jgi:DNA excision repair protein ERCC-5
MGVTGLWTVVQPCARPIKLETLNKKRLAVDASIWIYQFLKAVRDKEGNALRNSHVVGFFRRICKLLYFGVKPVFVFDGGAPALKRSTIAGRKRRRDGRREDAVRTAGRLLAVQMRKRAEDEERERKEERERVKAGGSEARREREEEEIREEDLVYAEEIGMNEAERRKNRTFKKKDQYHLPDLDVSISEMGAPNDPRVMSQEELEDYARQFHSGEDIHLYDFSKIDFNSPFFLSLPASDRYNLLNAARLRSRLRMGLSKDQLDKMFPDRMAFSRFQIERVKERNMLTQRLMNLTGMNGIDGTLGPDFGGRIAGEKGREYVLVKNDGVEGGWALGVVTNKDDGKQSRPIDVDEYGKEPKPEEDDEEWEDEDGFEDVPIEGLNRLPKIPKRVRDAMDYDEAYRAQEIADKRRAVYEARQQASRRQDEEEQVDDDPDALFVTDSNARDAATDALFEDGEGSQDEDDELRRAIEMSLEKPADHDGGGFQHNESDAAEEQPTLNFNKESAQAGRGFAKKMNAKAKGPAMFDMDEDEDFDLQSALTESRTSKYQPQRAPNRARSRTPPRSKPKSSLENDNPFGGPLPFESLDLGTSILGKKKKKRVDESLSGGFERDLGQEKDAPKPLPPWFAGEAPRENIFSALTQASQQDDGLGDENDERFRKRTLNRMDTGEVINVESQPTEVINVDSDEDEQVKDKEVIVVDDDDELPMDDVADSAREEPAVATRPDIPKATAMKNDSVDSPPHHSDGEEIYEWEDSDHDEPSIPRNATHPHGGQIENSVSKSPSMEFENVAIPDHTNTHRSPDKSPQADDFEEALLNGSLPNSNASGDSLPPYESDNENENGYNEFSDPEDEDLMAALAAEAEEHARFASSLNQKSATENAMDYEHELKQLRNQQKKDRRDADEVSHIMVTECQALLRHFGLPYITAPMEAEAQCAELISLGLVDGIVTDDSDIFLFGGTRVYKNMFNDKKFVECYLSSDLEKEYALTRNKLIHFAHLLGSDYTDGIPGVGPVTALEILTDFSTLDEFSTWWSQVQIHPKSPALISTPFRKKFAKNTTKLFLPPSFPDPRVDIAYQQPEVDSTPEPFQWGVPDLDNLRNFLMATIGWSQERADEILVPVIRDMNRRENEGTQANITSFLSGGVGAGAFAPRVRGQGGGRMEKAFGRLRREAERKRGAVTGDDVAEGVVESVVEPAKKKRKGAASAKGANAGNSRKKKGKERETTEDEDKDVDLESGNPDVDEDHDADDSDADGVYEAPAAKKASKRQSRKGTKTS